MNSYRARDPFSSFSHLVGALLALCGLIYMLNQLDHISEDYGIHLASYLVFGVSMVLMFFASGIYHYLDVGEGAIKELKRIDHISIFLLIAGSYTPYCLLALKSDLGWWLFGIAWGIAIFGIFIKIFWLHAPRVLSTLLYLGMGWIGVFAMGPLKEALSEQAFFWLVAGGIMYSVGAVVYATKWPNPIPKTFGFHEIWHLFVLGGAVSHFISVAVYI